MVPLACMTLIGPISSGRKTPRPPPSTIAGPPMPSAESLVAMITSQQPRMAALPAKQRPELTPTSGTDPDSRPQNSKPRVKPPPSVSPGRPPPPSVKNTTGRRHFSASSLIRSSFQWLLLPWVPASTV